MNEGEVMQSSVLEAWNIFKVSCPINSQDFIKGRYGFKIRFDMMDFENNDLYINRKMKKGISLIKNVGWVVDNTFNSELLQREAFIKNWLIDNYVEDDVIMSRIAESDE